MAVAHRPVGIPDPRGRVRNRAILRMADRPVRRPDRVWGRGLVSGLPFPDRGASGPVQVVESVDDGPRTGWDIVDAITGRAEPGHQGPSTSYSRPVGLGSHRRRIAQIHSAAGGQRAGRSRVGGFDPVVEGLPPRALGQRHRELVRSEVCRPADGAAVRILTGDSGLVTRDSVRHYSWIRNLIRSRRIGDSPVGPMSGHPIPRRRNACVSVATDQRPG